MSLSAKAADDVPSTTANSFDEASKGSQYLNVDRNNDQQASEQTSTTDIANEKQMASAVEEPPRQIQGLKWTIVVVAILSSIFLFALDNTIVAVIQPPIVETFGAVEKLAWLSVAFLLGSSSTNLIWGKIYSQFNAKWTYILCTLIFEVGSAICGGANNMNTLIIGRAICGVGGVGLYIGVLTLLSVTTTMHERPLYIASTGLMWGLGTVLGPVIGGALADSSAGWRWAFYINLCIAGLFAPVYLFILPSADPRPGTAYMKRWAEMDWVGSVVLIGAFVSGVMAISFGGLIYSWGSGQTIALFVVSAVLFAVFIVQQEFALLTTTSRRLFPVKFVRSRTMTILFAETACAACGVVVPLYMIPLFFQFTRGDTALDSGVRLLPYIVLMVFFCLLNGAVLSKYGLYMPWYTVGGVLVTIGSALLYTIDSDSSNSKVYGYSALVGIGVGMFIQASFSVAQASVTPEEIPSAVGFITCAQMTGITISIAVAESVFLNKAEIAISAILPNTPVDQIQAAISGVGSTFVASLPDDVRASVLKAIVGAMSKSYVGVIAAGALGTILSLFMKFERLFLEVPAAG